MFGIYDIDKACKLNFKQRLDIYKSVGFEEVAFYIDNSYLNKDENWEQITNYAKKIGLKVNQVHIDYKISNLICDEQTNKYFEYLEQKINDCINNNIPLLVTHASMGDNPPVISKNQLYKLKNLSEKYQNSPVTICFENVRNNTNLESILNLNLKNVKMCFDLGHSHCYGDEKQIFEKFKKHIVCTHLHNNFGKDTHNLLTNGEIDYKYFLKKLNNENILSNCLECFPEYGKILTEEEFKNFIKLCFESLAL
ncbi:MAG: TIM barrel protein [Clostridia bacterium]|nr:TIM barrel protein [Clostridia bacterium]